MDLGIAGRVALVVGGSRGMGQAISQHLARDGARVVVVARQQGPIDEAVQRLREAGGEAAGVSADCTSPEGRARAVAAAREAFGDPEILVWNVEMGYRLNFDTATEEDFLRGNNALVLSFVAMAKALAPAMKAGRWGRILTVSAGNVRQVDRDLSLIVDTGYRHAAAAISKVMSNELGPFGITVNSVGPGSIGTEMHRASFESRAKQRGLSYEEMHGILVERIPMGRLGKPEEFGAVCAFLCSELAGFVTGQTLLVDGGRYQGF